MGTPEDGKGQHIKQNQELVTNSRVAHHFSCTLVGSQARQATPRLSWSTYKCNEELSLDDPKHHGRNGHKVMISAAKPNAATGLELRQTLSAVSGFIGGRIEFSSGGAA